MALPTITQTWKQLNTASVPGKRIAFVSLLDAMQNWLFNFKDHLVTNSGATTKYAVVWSASGGTGPTNSSDHTDRWTNAAAVTPRATIAGASQAWIVFSGALGEQYLVTYQGASDDICRISWSPSAAFTLAGTTNQQPTATDEIVLCSATSVIGSTASADRIQHVWVRDDAKGWRVWTCRLSASVGLVMGVEEFTSGVISPASVSPAVWGFCYTPGTNMSATNIFGVYSANARGGQTRTLVSSVNYTCQVVLGCETFGGVTSAPGTYTYTPELQGSGFVPYPVALHTTNQTGSRGRLGNAIDWWVVGPSGVADGDGFGNSYQFIQVGAALWPNPLAVAPTIT